MTGPQTPDSKGVRLYPPPPKDFDPFAATAHDLRRHGLPLRPDPHTQPGMAALWERKARRYRSFDHLDPQPDPAAGASNSLGTPALGPDPSESCGYSLFSAGGPFTALFVTWTVPDLHFNPSPVESVDQFHTFVSLGFLDVHVEMTVDSAENITSYLWAQSVGQINMPVAPGDVVSGSLCLETDSQGTAAYFFANETTGQTINFTVETGFPPAVTISAGVTRGGNPDLPPDLQPLARFGAVYFDEISAYSTSGAQSLTAGDAITMVAENGSTLASPVRLNDYAFKVVYGTG